MWGVRGELAAVDIAVGPDLPLGLSPLLIAGVVVAVALVTVIAIVRAARSRKGGADSKSDTPSTGAAPKHMAPK